MNDLELDAFLIGNDMQSKISIKAYCLGIADSRLAVLASGNF